MMDDDISPASEMGSATANLDDHVRSSTTSIDWTRLVEEYDSDYAGEVERIKHLMPR